MANPATRISFLQFLFFAGLGALDEAVQHSTFDPYPPGTIFQGPIADALTHIGQINYLRRLAGDAVRGENYFKAEIVCGRVGPQQAPAVKEFG